MSTVRYYLGVDGGGTNCRARLTDLSGVIIGEAVTGPANTSAGVEQAYASVLDAVHLIISKASLPAGILSNIVAGLGLAGVVDQKSISMVEGYTHPFHSVIAQSDGYAACFGAHEGKDGGIAIFGTGSNCLGIIHSQIINIGGWGFRISDHGSGAQLGLQAIRYALLAADGVMPSSSFTEALLQQFDSDLAQAVRWSLVASPKEYAELAKFVVQFAAEGQSEAVALLKQAAMDAEMLIAALVGKGVTRVALLGGLSEYLLPYFSNGIQQYFCKPAGDAMDGALLMARRSAGGESV